MFGADEARHDARVPATKQSLKRRSSRLGRADAAVVWKVKRLLVYRKKVVSTIFAHTAVRINLPVAFFAPASQCCDSATDESRSAPRRAQVTITVGCSPTVTSSGRHSGFSCSESMCTRRGALKGRSISPVIVVASHGQALSSWSSVNSTALASR